MKITRSYNRKISHEAHGGIRYETTDIWATYEDEVDENDKEAIQTASRSLHEMAKAEVGKAVSEEIAEIKKVEKEAVPF